MGKSKDQQETQQERALADVARAQLANFEAKWAPLQAQVGRQVVASGAPGSFDRRRGAAAAGVDTGAAFSVAQEKLNTAAGTSGQFGGAKHKLGLVGMGNDKATSSGSSTVAAGQAADSGYVAGLKTMTALGRGEKATAVDGMTRAAGISALQARADADRSLENRMGNAHLAGRAAGVGAGLYLGADQPKPTFYETASADGTLPDDIGDARFGRQGNPNAYQTGGLR